VTDGAAIGRDGLLTIEWASPLAPDRGMKTDRDHAAATLGRLVERICEQKLELIADNAGTHAAKDKEWS